MALGAGRDKVDDDVDPAVGIFVNVKPGERVRRGDRVFDVCYRDSGRLARARALLIAALEIADAAPSPRPLIIGEIAAPAAR